MNADTCTAYVMEAKEVDLYGTRINFERTVWIVMDTDGDWYKTYIKPDKKNRLQ